MCRAGKRAEPLWELIKLFSKSPHTLRRGYITAALNAGQPVDVTAERTNVSREVLDKNYDARTESEKREVRRRFLQDV